MNYLFHYIILELHFSNSVIKSVSDVWDEDLVFSISKIYIEVVYIHIIKIYNKNFLIFKHLY